MEGKTMKEKIYTIPVTDAFREDCECPMCILEKKLENEYIEYFLGPSLMEPDCRIETNNKGFCRRHFEILYNSQNNRLGLGLIVDTHLQEQNKKLKKACSTEKNSGTSFVKGLTSMITERKSHNKEFVDAVIEVLENLEESCAVCSKLDYTMDRYIEVITYLWFKEDEFKKLFNSKKGFCLKHLKQLLEGAKKHLSPAHLSIFATNLLQIQVANMDRLQEEVHWSTQKFDYRNNDKPWGNSKDALPRSIQKIVGYCNLK